MTPLSDGIYITSDEHPEHVYRVDTATGKGYLIGGDGSETPIALRHFFVEGEYRVVAKPEVKPKFKVGDYADLYHASGTRLVALCRIIEGDEFEIVEPEPRSFLTAGQKYRIKGEGLKPTDRRPHLPHEMPGTLLRSPSTYNVVEVRPGGRVLYVHVNLEGGATVGQTAWAPGLLPPLAKWTPVKAVTKTEYVPV